MEFDSDDDIEIYTIDIDSIKPVDCIKNYEFFKNEWFDDLKEVIHYVEFMSPSEMIDENNKEPHIDLFDGSKWIEVTSLDVLDKEYVESLLYQLNEYYSRINMIVGKNMVTMYIAEIIPMTFPDLSKTTDPEDPGHAKVFPIIVLPTVLESMPLEICQVSPSG